MIAEILTPGPSLEKVRPSDLVSITDNRFSVNRSITRTDLDHKNWVVRDEKSFHLYHDHQKPHQVLWHPKDWIDKEVWHVEDNYVHELEEEFLNTKRAPYKASHIEINNSLGWERGNRLKWGYTSTFSAMSIAIRLGATEIRIWGSDFEGDGSTGVEYNQSYWSHVKEIYSDLKKACEDNGVAVKRCFP